MIKFFKNNYWLLITLVFLILLWLYASSNNSFDTLFFPKIEDFINSFIESFANNNFLSDIGISIFRVVTAFLFALVIAVPIALMMNSWKIVYKILSPYIDFIRYLPVPALIPLTILFFGIGELAKITLLFIGTFFQLVLLIINDLHGVPKGYTNLAYTLKFSRFKIIKMKLSSILPQLYNNSRITLGWCWTYLIIAELVAANSGIGHMIKEAQRFSDIPTLYVGIVTIGIIGFLTDYTFKKLYPYIFKYK
jgi:NitT/TauT family transport system permease protein